MPDVIEKDAEVPVQTQVEVDATSDETLGEPGKKALVAERNLRAAAEAEKAALAARVKELEDRDKSEADKAAERLADAQRRTVELEARATRAEISSETKIPVELLAGPKSTSPEDLKAFADAINEHVKQNTIPASEQPKRGALGPYIPSEGGGSSGAVGTPDFNALIAQAQKDRNFPLVITLRQQQAAAAKKEG